MVRRIPQFAILIICFGMIASYSRSQDRNEVEPAEKIVDMASSVPIKNSAKCHDLSMEPKIIFKIDWLPWFCIPKDATLGCSNSPEGKAQQEFIATNLSKDCDVKSICAQCAAHLFDEKFTCQIDPDGTQGSPCNNNEIGCRFKYEGPILHCHCK